MTYIWAYYSTSTHCEKIKVMGTIDTQLNSFKFSCRMEKQIVVSRNTWSSNKNIFQMIKPMKIIYAVYNVWLLWTAFEKCTSNYSFLLTMYKYQINLENTWNNTEFNVFNFLMIYKVIIVKFSVHLYGSVFISKTSDHMIFLCMLSIQNSHI